MAEKDANEWSAIHAALAEKARAGDLDAIRLYPVSYSHLPLPTNH